MARKAQDTSTDHQPLLFEMLRSFVSLAKHLNLTATVVELGSTRQTVRRHIALLEQAKGGPLFEVIDRQYHLTDLAWRALPEANSLLKRGRAWLSSEAGFEQGMLRIGEEDGPWRMYLQQRPLSHMWQNPSPFLRQCVQAWAQSAGSLEHEAFAPVRPYAMIFRPHGAEWLCAEVGKKSSFATWYGWEWQSSSVGLTLGGFPGGPVVASILGETFDDIKADQGLRYEHVHTMVARRPEDPLLPVNYLRLMMGSRFPDGSFALISVIQRTNDIQIDGMPAEYIGSMDPKMEMDVRLDISDQ